MKIVIATPAYGGMVTSAYATSLINTLFVLQSKNISCYPMFINNESLITRARNNIVAKMLADKTTTHLLFIDADIAWDPIEVLRLIESDKDVIGGIYPLKTYKFENITNIQEINARHELPHNKHIPMPTFLKQNLLKYNLNFRYNNFAIENNCCVVEHVATGFMLIKREVLEKMIVAHPELKFADDMGILSPEEDKYAYTLFDCAIVNTHYYSEDWLFCHRWKLLGGNVYANVLISLTHIGTHMFEGRLLSSLNIQAATPAPEKTEEEISIDKIVKQLETYSVTNSKLKTIDIPPPTPQAS